MRVLMSEEAELCADVERINQQAHENMGCDTLTKEMVDAFVDSIIIHGKYDYEIKLVYDDQFAELQKIMKEKEAQSR